MVLTSQSCSGGSRENVYKALGTHLGTHSASIKTIGGCPRPLLLPLGHRPDLCHRLEHTCNSPNKNEAGQEAQRGLWTGPASPHTTDYGTVFKLRTHYRPHMHQASLSHGYSEPVETGNSGSSPSGHPIQTER